MSSGFGPTRDYCQTRDLTPYARLDFRVLNATHAAISGFLQLKDYRDSLQHRAVYPFHLSAGDGWSEVSVPLAPGGPGWQVFGQPDLSRVLTVDFRFAPQAGVSSGRIFLTDVSLTERALRWISTPVHCRCWRNGSRGGSGAALWAARSPAHGLIPNNSYQSTNAGLNTTAAMLWMLPAAARLHWVPRQEADDYVAELTSTIGRLLDRAKYLPPRNVDWVTLQPSLLPEESVVDAAFLALALHQYKSQPSTPPALRAAIDRTQSRFNFAPFACPAGCAWPIATRGLAVRRDSRPAPTTGIPTKRTSFRWRRGTRPGRGVPIEAHWNSSTHRVRAGLDGATTGPLVHSMCEYRAPFAQALWNLFVNVRQRSADCYPDHRLAGNPWQNFVCYEQEVMVRLAQAGRPYLVQPDAGDDGSLTCYRQFSIYDDFGRRDLFMPWSAAFPLLAGADRSEATLRFLLRHGLHDPFGLADSANWATGARRAVCSYSAARFLEHEPLHDGVARVSRPAGQLRPIVCRIAGGPCGAG